MLQVSVVDLDILVQILHSCRNLVEDPTSGGLKLRFTLSEVRTLLLWVNESTLLDGCLEYERIPFEIGTLFSLRLCLVQVLNLAILTVLH